MDVAVLHTGTANVASVLACLSRLGATPHVTTDLAVVKSAMHLVVPGVGSFGACLQSLTQLGLKEVLLQRVQEANLPTLGICLGMQLFCQGSDESPGVSGLAFVHGTVRRFGATARVPQLGWNEVRPQGGCHILTPGYAYFAHSYRLENVPVGFKFALTDHDGIFVSALERGPILLCQFHPELSGAYGEALIARWLGKEI